MIRSDDRFDARLSAIEGQLRILADRTATLWSQVELLLKDRREKFEVERRRRVAQGNGVTTCQT